MDYIVVRTSEGVKRIHLSEISVLIVESTAVSVTAYALGELIANKVKVIFCDRARNPQAELVPLHGSHDTTGKICQQMEYSINRKQVRKRVRCV